MVGPLLPSPTWVGNFARSNAQYDDWMNVSGALVMGPHVQRVAVTCSVSGLSSVRTSWRTMCPSGNTVNVDEPPELCLAFVLHGNPDVVVKLQRADQTTWS